MKFLLVCTMLITTALSVQAQDDDLFDYGEQTDLYNFKISKPLIVLGGGMSSFSRDGISVGIEDDLSFTLRLLMTRNSKIGMTSTLKRSEGGVYIDYLKAPSVEPIQGAQETSPIIANTMAADYWKFGFESGLGYGYYLGDGPANISFFASSSALSWTTINIVSEVTDTTQTQRLRDFDNSLRFGELSRAAIDFQVAEAVSLRAGFDWQQVYPRHLFWFWGLSQLIEGIADGGVTWFVNEIGKSSPAAKPIVHFLLQNGLAMGFKALRQNQMNWPFTTEAPLNIMTYNIAVAVHF